MTSHELKKGSAELLILSLLEPRARHGYELSKQIEARSRGVCASRGLPLPAPLPAGEARLGPGPLGGEGGAAAAPLLPPHRAGAKRAQARAAAASRSSWRPCAASRGPNMPIGSSGPSGRPGSISRGLAKRRSSRNWPSTSRSATASSWPGVRLELPGAPPRRGRARSRARTQRGPCAASSVPSIPAPRARRPTFHPLARRPVERRALRPARAAQESRVHRGGGGHSRPRDRRERGRLQRDLLVLLRPLPFPEPDRLVTFWGSAPAMGLPVVAYPDAFYVYFRSRSHTLDPLAMYASFGMTLPEERASGAGQERGGNRRLLPAPGPGPPARPHLPARGGAA